MLTTQTKPKQSTNASNAGEQRMDRVVRATELTTQEQVPNEVPKG